MFHKFLRRTVLNNKNFQLLRYVNRCEARGSGRLSSSYEGEGKTTVRVINQEQELGLMIDTYATYGFRLNTGVTVLGPMAIFPRSVLSWQVTDAADITEESLRLFKVLEPKIDLLVIGLERSERSKAAAVVNAARANKLNVEVLTTEHACSTFNFLVAEGRCVAGALLPPHSLTMNEDDMLRHRLHHEELFNKPL